MPETLKFSANLGFLWTELPLPEAIRAAHEAGFSAVEMHWPYAVPVETVKDVLGETGLPVIGLNTIRGSDGEFGLAALPGREAEARAAIDEAVAYAAAIGCRNVHVMAGKADGPEARAAFIDNLGHAVDKAAPYGIGIIIEPLNSKDVPGYFLAQCDEAASIIREVGSPHLKILFDCYHVALMSGDVLAAFRKHRAMVGHIQFAAVPDRGAPDHGDVDYSRLLPEIVAAGHEGWFGAEYRPGGPTEASLGWMRGFTAAT